MVPDSARIPAPDFVNASPLTTPPNVRVFDVAVSIVPPDAPRVTLLVEARVKDSEARSVPPLIVTPALVPPRFRSAATETLPLVIVVVPEYEFEELLRVRTPVPFFESEPPVPEMSPAYVVEVLSPPLVSVPDPRVIAPVPDASIEPTSRLYPATLNVAPSETETAVWAERALLAPMVSEPAEIEVAPVYVLEPDIVSVPEPDFVSVPVPVVTAPETTWLPAPVKTTLTFVPDIAWPDKVRVPESEPTVAPEDPICIIRVSSLLPETLTSAPAFESPVPSMVTYSAIVTPPVTFSAAPLVTDTPLVVPPRPELLETIRLPTLTVVLPS